MATDVSVLEGELESAIPPGAESFDEKAACARTTSPVADARAAEGAGSAIHDRAVCRPLVRRVVLGVVFAAAAVGIVLGSGFGTLSSFGWEQIAAICLLGALEAMLASKLLIPQALAFLLIVAAVGILLGKVFCSWVCPVPPMRRVLDAVARTAPRIRTDKEAASGPRGLAKTSLRVVRPLSRKEQRLLKVSCSVSADSTAVSPEVQFQPATPRSTVSAASSCASASCARCVSDCASASRPALDSRHLVLGGSLLSAALFGFPVFCLVCPIGLTFATIIVVVQLFGAQTLSWGLLLFPLLLVLELTVLRKWCGRFCPMGALVSLFARPNRTFRPKVDEGKCLRSHGVDCQICAGVCPEGLDPHSAESMHECSKCRDCAVNCPAGAITLPRR